MRKGNLSSTGLLYCHSQTTTGDVLFIDARRDELISSATNIPMTAREQHDLAMSEVSTKQKHKG